MNGGIFLPRRYGKVWEGYWHLLNLQYSGKGGDTLMICYPDAPFHYVEKQTLWEMDGIPQTHHYREKVYDYPIKTVDEWIEQYNKWGYFVKSNKEVNNEG